MAGPQHGPPTCTSKAATSIAAGSSPALLQSCGTRGRAPYNAVLTHGFTMDQKGLKMSKSVGNTVDPLKVMETNGADIIRLWALSVDYHRGPPDRRRNPERRGGPVSQAAQHLPLPARRARRVFSEAEKVPMWRRCRSWSAMCSTCWRTWTRSCGTAVDDFDFNSLRHGCWRTFANE
jgi:isoleucyl-tRNA synthetase